MTCGTCGRTWSDEETPTPAGRCPFEYDHEPTASLYDQRVARVRLLTALLQDEGIACEANVGGRDEPHVMVWLTDCHEDTQTYLAIGTEGERDVTPWHQAWVWYGQFMNGPFGQDWSEGVLEVHERPWQGEGLRAVAVAYGHWCEVLRLGVGRYVDQAEVPRG